MRKMRKLTRGHEAAHDQLPVMAREVPLRGRRGRRDAANSVAFLARVEGVQEYDGHVRSANGIRWKVA